MDLDLERFHFSLSSSLSSLHIHAKKIAAIVGAEIGWDSRMGEEGGDEERNPEKGGKGRDQYWINRFNSTTCKVVRVKISSAMDER